MRNSRFFSTVACVFSLSGGIAEARERRKSPLVVMLALLTLPPLLLVTALPAWSQSLTTEDSIETDAQLVSKVATGTPPLVVSSETLVPNLNATLLGGLSPFEYFIIMREFVLDANPDPPCFSNTHRFVDCGNGTVTDAKTGLIWLKDAGCLLDRTYPRANEKAAALFDGATIDSSGSDCGLTDESKLGDWRLPTRGEWLGIAVLGCTDFPKILGNQSPTPGCYTDVTDPDSEWASGLQSSRDKYWSSTTDSDGTDFGVVEHLNVDFFFLFPKDNTYAVWPVRGGQ